MYSSTEGEGEAAEEEGVSADEEEDSSPSVKFGDEPVGDEGEEGMLCYPNIVLTYMNTILHKNNTLISPHHVLF